MGVSTHNEGLSYARVAGAPDAGTVELKDVKKLFGDMSAMLAQILQKLS